MKRSSESGSVQNKSKRKKIKRVCIFISDKSGRFRIAFWRNMIFTSSVRHSTECYYDKMWLLLPLIFSVIFCIQFGIVYVFLSFVCCCFFVTILFQLLVLLVFFLLLIHSRLIRRNDGSLIPLKCFKVRILNEYCSKLNS